MAKRGNDASQDSATAAPALRLSPNFQSSSADIELRSKDGVCFLVHKANLSVSSTVFADMFDSGAATRSGRVLNSRRAPRFSSVCWPTATLERTPSGISTSRPTASLFARSISTMFLEPLRRLRLPYTFVSGAQIGRKATIARQASEIR
ncbi:hypothetical protein BCR35DRAFT_196878 [Leucosporidium creatinivorum]|uniref:BTB domain-containing protein n=1 Tax=Leucosporidium creatinivorum TaxID=106004 RepID=A0A1Y2DPG8_9BASI|nr:hypothetical protein BCR35DRAFT_196878 [Leucosporidium creatinivorum]